MSLFRECQENVCESKFNNMNREDRKNLLGFLFVKFYENNLLNSNLTRSATVWASNLDCGSCYTGHVGVWLPDYTSSAADLASYNWRHVIPPEMYLSVGQSSNRILPSISMACRLLSLDCTPMVGQAGLGEFDGVPPCCTGWVTVSHSSPVRGNPMPNAAFSDYTPPL